MTRRADGRGPSVRRVSVNVLICLRIRHLRLGLLGFWAGQLPVFEAVIHRATRKAETVPVLIVSRESSWAVDRVACESVGTRPARVASVRGVVAVVPEALAVVPEALAAAPEALVVAPQALAVVPGDCLAHSS